MLLLSACNTTSSKQQQATTNKTALDNSIVHARSIGVPSSMLQRLIDQETQLSQTHTPLTLFSSQPADAYYQNLAQRYQMLTVQVRALETQSTQQLDYQATLDLQSFANILAQRQSQGFVETKTFADSLTSDQKLMAQAQYPKNYIQISTYAKASTQALQLMGPAYDKLTTLQNTIKQMDASHLDTTMLNRQAQSDLQLFRNASKPSDFTNIMNLLDAQLQGATALSTQAIPYVGAAKLRELSNDIDQMKQYNLDTTSYQKLLDADKTSLNKAKTLSDFLVISSQVDKDVASIQMPMLRGQANYLLKQFHDEATNWGNAHQYHNAFDGKNYALDYEYAAQGIGSDLDDAVQSAQTTDDYQAAIDQLNNALLHLKTMEADYNDKTSWDQPHATDAQLMSHYNATSGTAIVISLVEQSLRLYQDGKLVKSFLVTTGQFDKPTPPGLWHIFSRQSPTFFKSSEPKGSAFWYPDTNITYAMEWRTDGYFIHDSWWRVNYGPGTNFPHNDSGGDESFAGSGSHGCINMPTPEAGWVYNNTTYGTPVIIY